MHTPAKWIKPAVDTGAAAPQYEKSFSVTKEVTHAVLSITALGIYEAELNGTRVGEFVLAPGFTSYETRLQVQRYDVTKQLSGENHLSVLVGRGWYRSWLCPWMEQEWNDARADRPSGLIAWLEIHYTDGTGETIITDESWTARESQVRFSEIYDGEIYDATFAGTPQPVLTYDGPTEALIEQEGTCVKEMERVFPARMFRTPKGETVLDFGQNLTGYVQAELDGTAGQVLDLSFAEVLDKNGNFYTENYRAAKCTYRYTCKDGKQVYKPRLTFWGFRYIRVNAFPGGVEAAKPENFTAIVLYSEMERTGYLRCSDFALNQLFDNIIWGQKSNFVDVPTDCPQRDERMGWTGDAQVFCRAACMNFDVEAFFAKWLADLREDQHEDGYVGVFIPDLISHPYPSAAYGDAATIIPWEVYLAYGNRELLEKQFDSMCKWVCYINTHTEKENLWFGGQHYGDWLGLDAPSGSYKGSSREPFIASAFFAYSASLVIKAGKALGKDVSEYEALHGRIVKAFREAFPMYQTQTECVLAAYFGLAEDPQAAADQLAQMVKNAGVQMKTGFVGTPYLLHVLSSFGYTELAYSLLLRREYPSWLYPVSRGATTIWEHWDGIMEDGSFWSADMNSFNHYAYGSVADWVYAVAAGIRRREDAPGYSRVTIEPHPDARLDWLEGRLQTRHGMISSRWQKQEGMWRFDIETPVEAEIMLGGETKICQPGKYTFFREIR